MQEPDRVGEEPDWARAAPPRRPWALLAGVVALVAGVGWLSGLQLEEPEGLEVVTDATAPATLPATLATEAGGDPLGTWRTLGAAGLADRTGHSATWTGAQLLVFGGWPDPGARRFIAFDPADGTVTELDPGPVGNRAGHAAVWTGSELVVIGGQHVRPAPASSFAGPPVEADVGIFDPRTGDWRSVTGDPGIALGQALSAVWAAPEVMVVGRSPDNAHAVAAALDPAAGSWRALPDPPLGPYPSPIGVWTGAGFPPRGAGGQAVGAQGTEGLGEVLFWSGQQGGPAAALAPQAAAWRELAPSPADVRPLVEPVALWAGGRMLLVGRPMGSTDPPLLLSVTPHGTWWQLPAPPLSYATSYGAVWTGDTIYLVGGERERPGAVFDAFGVWEALGPGPVGPVHGHTVTWTGAELLVVGGLATPGVPNPTGAAFTPS